MKTKLILNFENEEQREFFTGWLSNSGEQEMYEQEEADGRPHMNIEYAPDDTSITFTEQKDED